MTIEDRLEAFAKALDEAPRTGADQDDPEGARVVTLSETAAKALACELRLLAMRVRCAR